MQLSATETERRDIGGALADWISYFDDAAPFVKLLNFLGPAAGVIDGVADAIYRRIVYIAEHRSGRAPSPQRPYPPAVTTPTPAGNGRASYEGDDDDVITAPDPAAAQRSYG